jgi:hypothetical protein
VPAATSYRIYRSVDGHTFALLRATTTTRTALSTGMAPGAPAWFRLQATVAGHVTAFSPIVRANSAPLAPTALTVTNVSPTSQRVSWRAATGATAYRVYRASGDGVASLVATTTAAAYTATGLASATAYTWQVRALAGSALSTPSTSALRSTTVAAPVVLGTGGLGEMHLTWGEVVGATSYRIDEYASSAWTSLGTTDDASWHITGLDDATSYSYRVCADGPSGAGPCSATATASTTTPTGPAAPAALVATPAPTSLDLTWTASSGATSYLVYLTEAGQEPESAGSVTNPSAHLTGLPPATTFTVEVRPVSAAGTGYRATTVASTTLVDPAVVVTEVAATWADLSWASVTRATSYTVETWNGSGYSVVATTSDLAYRLGSLTPDTWNFVRVRAHRYAIASAGLAGASLLTQHVVPGL